jgi:hypothetical protein
MSHLRRIIPVALAIVASAAPPAQAKLDDRNAISSTPGHAQDLRSPDTRDLATGYAPAPAQDLRAPDTREAADEHTLARAPQDLRSPDTRDAATANPAPSTTGAGNGIDATSWTLLTLAVVASGIVLGAIARSRRTRVHA